MTAANADKQETSPPPVLAEAVVRPSPTQVNDVPARPQSVWARALGALAPRRWVVDVGLALSGTVAVALAGLVLNDILPAPHQEFGSTPARWAWTVAFLLVTSLLVGLRWKLTSGYGTLFYVQHLAADMPNWHLPTLRRQAKGYLDVRTVIRGFSAQVAGAFVDLVQDQERLDQDLQAELNRDRIDSGYTLAPNLILPSAMALGSSLYWWPGMTLIEFLGSHSISWQPPDDWPSGDAGLKGAKVTASGPVESDGQHHHLVLAALTGQGPVTRPPGRYATVSRVDLRHGDEKPLPVTMEQNPHPESGHVDPVGASLVLAAEIQRALHELPDDDFLVLAARLPKTVAAAVGRLIAERRCAIPRCARPACRDPWSRLLVPYWDQATSSYVWPRVHRSQPKEPHMDAVA